MIEVVGVNEEMSASTSYRHRRTIDLQAEYVNQMDN